MVWQRRRKIEESKADLPPDTEFVAIEGGNHTQFGWYDTYPAPVQPGDNSPGITRQQQQCRILSSTAGFLKSFRRICAATALLGKGNPQLAAMRHIRDAVLAKSAPGRKLIKVYYQNGEPLTALFNESPCFKNCCTIRACICTVPALNLLLLSGSFLIPPPRCLLPDFLPLFFFLHADLSCFHQSCCGYKPMRKIFIYL